MKINNSSSGPIISPKEGVEAEVTSRDGNIKSQKISKQMLESALKEVEKELEKNISDRNTFVLDSQGIADIGKKCAELVRNEGVKSHLKAQNEKVKLFLSSPKKASFNCHKFKTGEKLGVKTCLPDAIGTALFGRTNYGLAEIFTNSLREYLIVNKKLKPDDDFDADNNEQMSAIFEYIKENYGINVNLQVMGKFSNVDPVMSSADNKIYEVEKDSVEPISSAGDEQADFSIPVLYCRLNNGSKTFYGIDVM